MSTDANKVGPRFSKFRILRERTARGTATVFQSKPDPLGRRLEINYDKEISLRWARIYCTWFNRSKDDAEFWQWVGEVGRQVGHYARLVYDGSETALPFDVE